MKKVANFQLELIYLISRIRNVDFGDEALLCAYQFYMRCLASYISPVEVELISQGSQ